MRTYLNSFIILLTVGVFAACGGLVTSINNLTDDIENAAGDLALAAETEAAKVDFVADKDGPVAYGEGTYTYDESTKELMLNLTSADAECDELEAGDQMAAVVEAVSATDMTLSFPDNGDDASINLVRVVDNGGSDIYGTWETKAGEEPELMFIISEDGRFEMLAVEKCEDEGNSCSSITQANITATIDGSETGDWDGVGAAGYIEDNSSDAAGAVSGTEISSMQVGSDSDDLFVMLTMTENVTSDTAIEYRFFVDDNPAVRIAGGNVISPNAPAEISAAVAGPNVELSISFSHMNFPTAVSTFRIDVADCNGTCEVLDELPNCYTFSLE